MHVNADDIFVDHTRVQLPSAFPPADSAARHAHQQAAIERLPVGVAPPTLRKEMGSAAPVLSAAPSTRRSPTRLTRRGRLVLILLTTCLVAVAFGVGRASATSAPPAPLPTVVVQPGDTLWSIAARIAGDGDIRDTVEQITTLNGAAARSIQPGQRLALPGK